METKGNVREEFLGTKRDTFLIDPDGKIIRVWRNVSPKGHADEVKAALLAKIHTVVK